MNFYINYTDEELAAKKRRKRKIIIISAILLPIIFLIVYIILFSPSYHLPYEAMYDDIKIVRENDVNYFHIYATDKGKYTGGIVSPAICDFENDIMYESYLIEYSVSRWRFWFNKCNTVSYIAVTDDGRNISSTGTVGIYDADNIYHKLQIKYARVYYGNPDGSRILLWEHPDIAEIEANGTYVDLMTGD